MDDLPKTVPVDPDEYSPPSVADGTVDRMLVALLEAAGDEWGPTGVANVAAELAGVTRHVDRSGEYLNMLNDLGYSHVEAEWVLPDRVAVYVWKPFNRVEGRAFGGASLAECLGKALAWAANQPKD